MAEPSSMIIHNLPTELTLEVIELLPYKDQQTFSLLSHSFRRLVLPNLFRSLKYSQNLECQIENINQADSAIKVAIRELQIIDLQYSAFPELTVCQLLSGLPNLRVFKFYRPMGSDVEDYLNKIVGSLQNCPIERFECWTPNGQCRTVNSPSGLRNLVLKIHHEHVYNFIRPSFSTIVELQLRPYFPDDASCGTFDLLPLRPIGRTLQKFVYRADALDPELLDMIPDVFPYLTTLELIIWTASKQTQSFWKSCYDESIAKNTELKYLTVYAGHYSFCPANESSAAHNGCSVCEDHRLAVARDSMGMACAGLRFCKWENRHVRYNFIAGSSGEKGEMKVEIPFRTPELGLSVIPLFLNL